MNTRAGKVMPKNYDPITCHPILEEGRDVPTSSDQRLLCCGASAWIDNSRAISDNGLKIVGNNAEQNAEKNINILYRYLVSMKDAILK